MSATPMMPLILREREPNVKAIVSSPTAAETVRTADSRAAKS